MVFGFPLVGSVNSGGNFTSGLVSGLRGLRSSSVGFKSPLRFSPATEAVWCLTHQGGVIGVVQAKLDALRAAIDLPRFFGLIVT